METIIGDYIYIYVYRIMETISGDYDYIYIYI